MQQNRAEIRTDILLSNAQYFRSRAAGAAFCAVVKADAYGHGAAMTTKILSGTADMFAVSLVEEGVRLRYAGVAEDILVLTPPLCEEEVLRGALHGLIFSAGDAADYAILQKTAAKYGLCARCHFKVNTGMNRYGFSLPALRRFLRGKLSDRVSVEGIYSHFYRPENRAVTQEQFEKFGAFCRLGERAFGRLVKHIAATGGTLASREYCLDMVRIGIGLYGYLPAGFSLPQGSISPVMRVYSTVAAVHRYASGGAGYGDYIPHGKHLATVRSGYADGYLRSTVRGNCLCMDARVCESQARKYDDVCVLSDADVYAVAHGTIPYEVLVHASERAVKVYVDHEK